MSTNTATELYDDSVEVISPQMLAEGPAREQTYGQILKSSAIVGGSTALNVGIGIVRTKAMALLLGPGGFGLFGLYSSIQNLTQSVAGMGINGSGVRQIAAAAASGDKDRIAQTAAVLRRTAFLLGLLGALLLVTFSRQVSQVTFGNTEHTAAVSLLSIAVFFGLVSGGQGALIQGMRRIGDLAKMNVLSAFFGLCAAIPLVYLFRQKGVVLSLIAVACTTIVTSWWYSHKVDIERASVSLSQVRREASELLKLGSAFMASGLMTLGAAYAVRIFLLRNVGFEATGLYQSAWNLGGFYIGFVLQAMGADFYPRLTASIHNHPEANRLVNEQTLVGLLLAGPGVLFTLTFAPLVIMLFYSAKFGAAVGVLRWVSLGAALQVITWPMGFIIVAKGNQKLFLLAESLWSAVAIALAWVGVRWLGLNGAGIAFFGSYIFHLFLIYPIVHRLSGFRWSEENMRTGAIFFALIVFVFVSFYLMPAIWAASLGGLAAVASAIYSTRVFLKLIPSDRLPSPLRRVLLAARLERPQFTPTSSSRG